MGMCMGRMGIIIKPMKNASAQVRRSKRRRRTFFIG